MPTATNYRADVGHIAEAIRLMTEPGQVIEVRVPNYRGKGNNTASGYFDDIDELVRWASKLSGQAAAVYFTLNPVNPALLARAANRIVEYAKSTTSDADILRLRKLPVDLDAVRPAGISSTDEEHAAALQRARIIRDDQREAGWPEPRFGDSGNGAHLVYRIDLENTPENVSLLQRVIKVLGDTYTDKVVKVDQTTFNPSRIWKLYGTLVAKGDDIDDRPHRIARLLEHDELDDSVLTRAQLEAFVALAPPTDTGTADDYDNVFDLVAFVERHADKLQPRRVGEAQKWRITCPWNDAHVSDAVVGRTATGAIWAKCSHDSCSWNWHDLRERFDPAPTLVFDHVKPAASATNGTGPKVEVNEVDDGNDDEQPDINPLDGDAVDLRNLALGWIGEYAALAADITNSPYEFNVLNGLVALAAAIGGNAFMPFMNNLRPNLYGMIIAPSTVYHKSTTLGVVQDLFKRANAPHRLMSTAFSYEGLLSELVELGKSDDPNEIKAAAGLVIQNELGYILGSHRVKYLLQLKTSLTDLYDGQRIRRRLNSGVYDIQKPVLSILGATTPSVFYDSAGDVDWQSGFLVRWLFVAPETVPDFSKPLTIVTPQMERQLSDLAANLWNATQHEETRFTIDDTAMSMWNKYHAAENAKAFAAGDDRLLAIMGRYNTVAMKLAMLMADVTDTWGEVTPAAMITALQLTDYFKRALLRLLQERDERMVTGGKLQEALKVIHVSNVQGTAPTQRQLCRSTKNKAETMRSILDELYRRGAVVKKPVGRSEGFIAIVDKMPIGR